MTTLCRFGDISFVKQPGDPSVLYYHVGIWRRDGLGFLRDRWFRRLPDAIAQLKEWSARDKRNRQISICRGTSGKRITTKDTR